MTREVPHTLAAGRRPCSRLGGEAAASSVASTGSVSVGAWLYVASSVRVAVHTSLHDSSTAPETLIVVCGVLPVPREETSAVPLEGGLRIAEELPMPAGTGVSHSGTAPPQHLCVGSRGLVVEQNRRGLVTLDQHPLVRKPGRGRVVEERRHHRVVEQLEGDTRESVLEAAERSCHGCDSHGIRW